jgi:hypothetical protein
MGTAISWCDETWNCVTGCSRVSERQIGGDEGPFPRRLTERPHLGHGHAQSFHLLRHNAAHNRRAGLAAGVPPVGWGRRREPDWAVVSRQTSPGGDIPAAAAGETAPVARGSARVEDQLQSNRSAGGGRGAAAAVGSPRWVRIFRMTTGSDSSEAVAHSGLHREACACPHVADTIAKGARLSVPGIPSGRCNAGHLRHSSTLIRRCCESAGASPVA